jgi:ParB/RepB/Spo0J family partition protein
MPNPGAAAVAEKVAAGIDKALDLSRTGRDPKSRVVIARLPDGRDRGGCGSEEIWKSAQSPLKEVRTVANKRTIVTWKISKLKEHARQGALFDDLSDAELAALAADMKAVGLRDPIEALPDGTIVAGHQRVRAARRLGWKEIDVIVREDLRDAGPAAVRKSLITDNLLRRHLSPLARAHCIKELVELELGGRRSSQEAIKKQVGQLLGLSPRSVNRYLLVLATPVQVQRAFDRGELTLVNAGKVALLPKSAQAEIAQRIERGEKAATVIAEHLGKKYGGEGDVARAFGRLVRALRREGRLLGGQVVDDTRLRRCLPLLRAGGTLLAELVARAEREAS